MTNNDLQSYAALNSKRKSITWRQRCSVEISCELCPTQSVAKTIERMIVHHAGSLHKGVTDGRANEAEATALQIFAHRVGFRSSRRQAPGCSPIVFLGLAVNELPNVAVESSKLFLHRQECLRV